MLRLVPNLAGTGECSRRGQVAGGGSDSHACIVGSITCTCSYHMVHWQAAAVARGCPRGGS